MDAAVLLIVGVGGVGGDAGVSGVIACLPSPLEMAHAGARPVAVAAVRRLDRSHLPELCTASCRCPYGCRFVVVHS